MTAAEQGGQGGAHQSAHTPSTDMPSPAHPARPRFSESQAAKLCGVSRSTIQRARKRGDIPGVERLEHGWSLPLEGLLAAGFKPESGAGTPLGTPLPASRPGRVRHPAHPAHPERVEESPSPDVDNSKIHRLELELEQARAEARVMRAERDAAQAVANERQRIIALLEAPRGVTEAVGDPSPSGLEPNPTEPSPPIPKRSRWARAAGRWLS